jgi:hypothetical protein
MAGKLTKEELNREACAAVAMLAKDGAKYGRGGAWWDET